MKAWGYILGPEAKGKPMPLTNLAAKAAKPSERPYKLFDAKGFY